MNKKPFVCCICKSPIYNQYPNSAHPASDGVCCNQCNSDVVLPARLKYVKQMSIKE